jgi:hypothetical protein
MVDVIEKISYICGECNSEWDTEEEAEACCSEEEEEEEEE